jgi:hypothetical protein
MDCHRGSRVPDNFERMLHGALIIYCTEGVSL